MTGSLERELATVVVATLEADRDDAPRLLAIARSLRADPGLRYEADADYLEALARRKTERLRLAERLEAAGLLEDTAILAIADLDEETTP